jgi:hypothetical protein
MIVIVSYLACLRSINHVLLVAVVVVVRRRRKSVLSLYLSSLRLLIMYDLLLLSWFRGLMSRRTKLHKHLFGRLELAEHTLVMGLKVTVEKGVSLYSITLIHIGNHPSITTYDDL